MRSAKQPILDPITTKSIMSDNGYYVNFGANADRLKAEGKIMANFPISLQPFT
jgi:hypothetical protein